MTIRQDYYANLAKTLVDRFEKRRFEAYYCPTKEEALKKAMELVPENSLVSFGGSMTVKECGLPDALNRAGVKTIERDRASDPEEKEQLTRMSMDADVFFMSSNAFTREGELVNIDGFGNRVAALCYGPKSVVVLLGMNKLAQDRENGIWRCQNVASPMNTVRLERKTPCAITGECGDCYGDGSICSQILITRRSGIPKRIKIILIGEEMGY
ncbi:lactate utilization protein [Alkalibacter rhizosphaerae]|uniref:Lactate utilization protein n=1 Tax=Alkalibacter rhizosphaerae TaxID=2815577 RepID=A0A975AGP7_9FIRM|nr:lactate utilization protein [Alkalibacter rhizosphaerae]QSX07774.1 lactate utilization protein [Alkalibacter rhizosphaerae]